MKKICILTMVFAIMAALFCGAYGVYYFFEGKNVVAWLQMVLVLTNACTATLMYVCYKQQKEFDKAIKIALEVECKPVQSPDAAEIIRLVRCSFCFRDMYEMTKHPRSWYKCKPELQIGTELRVRSITRNFYGTFYCCEVPDGMKIEKGCIPTYDIPVNSAEVIKLREHKEDAV